MNLLTNKFFDTYISLLDVDVKTALAEVKEREWTVENLDFTPLYQLCLLPALKANNWK